MMTETTYKLLDNVIKKTDEVQTLTKKTFQYAAKVKI